MVDYWLLEESDALPVVIVLEDLEEERHELSHVIVHHLPALWDKLLTEDDSMRVDQDYQCELCSLISGQGLRDIKGQGKELALLPERSVPDVLILLLRQRVLLKIASEEAEQRLPKYISLELFVVCCAQRCFLHQGVLTLWAPRVSLRKCNLWECNRKLHTRLTARRC